MADTLHLEIVTAGGAAVDTQAQQVTLPLTDGEAGILPGHAPLLGALVSGVVRYTSGGRGALLRREPRHGERRRQHRDRARPHGRARTGH